MSLQASQRGRTLWLAAWLSALGWLLAAVPVRAERPATPNVLPRNTLAYVRVPDIKLLQERIKDTAYARMFVDPQMRPVVQAVYDSAASAWSELKTQIDLSLDELLAIPQGEMVLALIDHEDNVPAVVVLMDVHDHLPAAQKVIDRILAEMDKRGYAKSEATVGDLKLAAYQPPDRTQQFALGVKDGTVVVTTGVDVLGTIVDRWNGRQPGKDDPGTLSQNPTFAATMKCIRAEQDGDVQAVAYADPIALVRAFAHGNAAMTLGLAILPVLGLDGLKGVGGSVSLGQGEFDHVIHGHLLLEQPRAGVVELVQLSSGDLTPERWVPADAASYTTLYWDFEASFGKGGKLFDSFQGDGAFARTLKENFGDKLGVDVEREIIAALDGRVTHLTHVARPVNMDSQGELFALKLKDSEAFQKTLDQIVGRLPESPEKKSFGGVAYYRFKVPDVPAGQPQPSPCFAVFEHCLMIADRTALLEKILASPLDASQSLAAELDFKLIASKIKKHAQGIKPGLILFNRPDEGMRMLYEMAGAGQVSNNMKRAGPNNPFMRGFAKVIEETPLPPFEVLAKYLAPAGSLVTNDETGLHYTEFSLRRAN